MILCKILQVQRQKSKLVNFFLLSWILIELRIFVDLGTQTARVLHSFPFSKNRPVTRFYSVAMPFQNQSSSQEEKAPGRVRPATLLKERLWHRCFPVNVVAIELFWWLLASVCLSFSFILYSKFSAFQIFLCILLSSFV